jgi:hypothetical protein
MRREQKHDKRLPRREKQNEGEEERQGRIKVKNKIKEGNR